MSLILASASPRRKEIFEKFGYSPVIIESNFEEEKVKVKKPAELVKRLSKGKAEAVLDKAKTGDIIVAADTIVVIDNEKLGKPKTKKDAFDMIKKINGRTHAVYTGVTVIKKRKKENLSKTFFDKTEVHVTDIPEKEIKKYIATGEPMGKAGAYAIQGSFGKYIDRINGDYYTVVGLPASKTFTEIENIK